LFPINSCHKQRNLNRFLQLAMCDGDEEWLVNNECLFFCNWFPIKTYIKGALTDRRCVKLYAVLD